MILRDHGHEAIAAWIDGQEQPPTYSDFGWGEFISALGRRVRATRLDHAIGTRIVAEAAGYFRHWSTETLVSAAVRDATEPVADFGLALRLPDAIHLAIARRLGLALASTDRQQLRAASTVGIVAIDPVVKGSE